MSIEKSDSEHQKKVLGALKDFLDKDEELDPTLLIDIDKEMETVVPRDKNADEYDSSSQQAVKEINQKQQSLADIHKNSDFTTGAEHRLPPEDDDD